MCGKDASGNVILINRLAQVNPKYQYFVMYVVDKDVKRMFRRQSKPEAKGVDYFKGKVAEKKERTYQNWGFVGNIAEKQFNPHIQKVIMIQTKFLIP